MPHLYRQAPPLLLYLLASFDIYFVATCVTRKHAYLTLKFLCTLPWQSGRIYLYCLWLCINSSSSSWLSLVSMHTTLSLFQLPLFGLMCVSVHLPSTSCLCVSSSVVLWDTCVSFYSFPTTLVQIVTISFQLHGSHSSFSSLFHLLRPLRVALKVCLAYYSSTLPILTFF